MSNIPNGRVDVNQHPCLVLKPRQPPNIINQKPNLREQLLRVAHGYHVHYYRKLIIHCLDLLLVFPVVDYCCLHDGDSGETRV